MGTLPTFDLATETDVELVRAAKRGDSAAFDILVRRYQKRVLSLALRITKNREDAEDVTQESFQEAFLHLQSFEERSAFSTWLMRIAFNEAFMLLRRKRARIEANTISSDASPTPFTEMFVDRQPGPEQSYWRHERKDVLVKALNRLSTPVRTIVVLREFEQRSTKETAEMLGVAITTVKARLHQGRKRLRTVLDPALLGDLHQPMHGENQL